MPQVIYTCPLVPPEWIAAHGLRPARIIPHSTHTHAAIPPVEGLCPFAQAFANHVLADQESQGAIFTTACDQMRRVRDLVVGRSRAETFLFNVPKTWQNAECIELYIEELCRLGRWLCTRGGRAPTADTLTATMVDFDQHRQALRAAGCNTRPSCSCHDGFVKLALIGGHLLAGEMQLVDIISRQGGRIMLDATETGELTRPAPFDPAGLCADPVRELARAYFESIPTVWKRPNTALFEWLTCKTAERQVQGIICHRRVWCDLWHAEVSRLRSVLRLPLLDLDVSDDGSCAQRTAGRIQAFLETLQ